MFRPEADPERGADPLFLDQTDEKFETPPPYLRVWMIAPSLSEGLDPPLSPIKKTNRHPSKVYCIFFSPEKLARLFFIEGG